MVETRYKGSTTIELAMMMPVVLLVITVVVQAGFYYHDKNLIYGKVHELGAIAMQQERSATGFDRGVLVEYFLESIEGKLLLFGTASCEVEKWGDNIGISVAAEKGLMEVSINREVSTYYVEQNIRRRQSILGD